MDRPKPQPKHRAAQVLALLAAALSATSRRKRAARAAELRRLTGSIAARWN